MTPAPYSVYWITDDLDSDMFNHGYVGITNRGVDTRYKEHTRLAFNKKYKSYWRELSKAIRLFGDNLFVKTICICDRFRPDNRTLDVRYADCIVYEPITVDILVDTINKTN